MRQKHVEIKFMLIALLPVFVHVVLFTVDILKNSPIRIGRLDLLIFILFVGYLFSLIFTVKYKEYFICSMLMMYSLFFAIAAIEICLKFTLNLPYRPMHIVSYPAEGVMPGVDGKIEFSVNKYGLRGPEMKLSDAKIKILTIGGSATECFYITDKLSWPWRLQDKLAEQLGKRVFVGNAGKSGNCASNYIYLLQRYQLTPRFDWIIILAGINDIGRLVRNDYAARNQKLEEETFYYHTNSAVYYRRLSFFQRLGVMSNKLCKFS